MKRALTAFAIIIATGTAWAEDVTPSYDPWYSVILNPIKDAAQWLMGFMLDTFGVLLQALFSALPTNLQTDLSPYADYLQIMNAWVPISEWMSLFMMYMAWNATYAGVRWTTRILRA